MNRGRAVASVWLTREECEEEDLPDVCCVCGEPAEGVRWQRFSWHPPLLYVTLLFGVFYLILTRGMVRRMQFPAPLCAAHYGYWSRYRTTMWGMVLGSLVVGAVGLLVMAEGPAGLGLGVAVAGGVGLVGLLVAAAVQYTQRVRPLEITDDDMRLTNVSDEFAAAVKEARRDRRAAREARQAARRLEEGGPDRRRRAESDEDGYDEPRRPRRRRSADDDEYDRG